MAYVITYINFLKWVQNCRIKFPLKNGIPNVDGFHDSTIAKMANGFLTATCYSG